MSKPAALLIAIASGAAILVNIGYLTWMATYLFDRFGMPLSKSGLQQHVFPPLACVWGRYRRRIISDHVAPGRPGIRLEIHAFALIAGAPVLLGAIKQMASVAEGLSLLAALYVAGAVTALWGSQKVVQTI